MTETEVAPSPQYVEQLEKDLHRARVALLRVWKFDPHSLPAKTPGSTPGLVKAFEKQKIIAGRAYQEITDINQHEELDKEVTVSGEE